MRRRRTIALAVVTVFLLMIVITNLCMYITVSSYERASTNARDRYFHNYINGLPRTSLDGHNGGRVTAPIIDIHASCGPGNAMGAVSKQCERMYYYPHQADRQLTDGNRSLSACADLYGYACGRWHRDTRCEHDPYRLQAFGTTPQCYLNAMDTDAIDVATLALFNNRATREATDDANVIADVLDACLTYAPQTDGDTNADVARDIEDAVTRILQTQSVDDGLATLRHLSQKGWLVPFRPVADAIGAIDADSRPWVGLFDGWHAIQFATLATLTAHHAVLDDIRLAWAGDLAAWVDVTMAHPAMAASLWTRRTWKELATLGLLNEHPDAVSSIDRDGSWLFRPWRSNVPTLLVDAFTSALDRASALARHHRTTFSEWLVDGVVQAETVYRNTTTATTTAEMHAVLEQLGVHHLRVLLTTCLLLTPTVRWRVRTETNAGRGHAAIPTARRDADARDTLVSAVVMVLPTQKYSPGWRWWPSSGRGSAASTAVFSKNDPQERGLHKHDVFVRRNDIEMLLQGARHGAAFGRGHCKRLTLLKTYDVLQHVYAELMQNGRIDGDGSRTIFKSGFPLEQALEQTTRCVKQLGLAYTNNDDANANANDARTIALDVGFTDAAQTTASSLCVHNSTSDRDVLAFAIRSRLCSQQSEDGWRVSDPFVPQLQAWHDPAVATTYIRYSSALLRLPWFVDKLCTASIVTRMFPWTVEVLVQSGHTIGGHNTSVRAVAEGLSACFADAKTNQLWWIELVQNWCATRNRAFAGFVPIVDHAMAPESGPTVESVFRDLASLARDDLKAVFQC